MRLDHLLSREQALGETQGPRPRSIPFPAEAGGGEEAAEAAAEPQGSKDCRFASPVSFSGFVQRKICGGLAQLGERLPCKQEVSGSIPLISTINGLLAQLVRALA